MKKIVVLCTLTLILTGCHDKRDTQSRKNEHVQVDVNEKKNSTKESLKQNKQPIRQKNIVDKNIHQIKQEISKEVTQHASTVPPVATKSEYIDTVKDYSKDMDKVINSMTLYEDKQDIEQQLEKLKQIVVTYESKVQSAEIPQIKRVDRELKKANEKYIESVSKISYAIESNDDTLKKDGYTEFSEGHTYLNRAYYNMQTIDDHIHDVTIEQNMQQNEPSIESVSLEIVVYKAGNSEEIPVESQSVEGETDSNAK
ncbi:hypothetical protein [Macrococcoides caseolyticum]|uniref:hypothetical protein n=1 Tax=Macrococcoides caseolyticum TaxID=69966 RepID=UPI001F1809EC|nr:hypothetical protein [Macrococcus caseolyticus]MCE4957774.1 hypothetical protein [Macrococcus caseolyticus]